MVGFDVVGASVGELDVGATVGAQVSHKDGHASTLTMIPHRSAVTAPHCGISHTPLQA